VRRTFEYPKPNKECPISNLVSFVAKLDIVHSLLGVGYSKFPIKKLQFQKCPFKTGVGVKIVLVALIQSLSHDPSLGLSR